MRPPRRSLRRSNARYIVPDRIRFRRRGSGCVVLGGGWLGVGGGAGCWWGVCWALVGCLPGDCQVFAGRLSGVGGASVGCLSGVGRVSVGRLSGVARVLAGRLSGVGRASPGGCWCLSERRWRSAIALLLTCRYARCFFGACSRAAASVRPLWLGFSCGCFAGAVPPRLLL